MLQGAAPAQAFIANDEFQGRAFALNASTPTAPDILTQYSVLQAAQGNTQAARLYMEAQQLLSEFTSHQPLVLGARMMEAQVQLGLADLAKKSGAATDQEDHLRKVRDILESIAKNRQPFKDLSLLQQEASASTTPKT